MATIKSHRTGWRKYQAALKKKSARKKSLKNLFKYFTIPVILILILYFTVAKIIDLLPAQTRVAHKKKEIPVEKKGLTKKDLFDLLNGEKLINLNQNKFHFTSNGIPMEALLTVDTDLQEFVLKKMKTDTSKYMGIVVMNPESGSILTMTGYNRIDPLSNPCTDITFPAASIFKIITAAAVIEKCGFTPESRVVYNGNKYTLYKSQLKNRINKYSNRVKFKDAFAQSINPVFGKIGMHYLNDSVLLKYSEAFGFNRQINFEIPLVPSSISISNKPYNWAEIACGFNRTTMITPLHGALIGSIILNKGNLVEPKIVAQVTGDTGKILYKSKTSSFKQVVSPETSAIIHGLMKNTVRAGTAKKIFRGYKKDRVLSRLNIGGKTGSINNNKYHIRFDWFVGFAEEKNGNEKIIVSVLVAHEKYIGITAGRYARIIMTKYFHKYFAAQKEDHKKS